MRICWNTYSEDIFSGAKDRISAESNDVNEVLTGVCKNKEVSHSMSCPGRGFYRSLRCMSGRCVEASVRRCKRTLDPLKEGVFCFIVKKALK